MLTASLVTFSSVSKVQILNKIYQYVPNKILVCYACLVRVTTR